LKRIKGAKMAKFNFVYKKKRINIDVRECRSFFSKTHGLMFRKNSKPLLFFFNKKTNEGIHSFFCLPFFAIWFDSDRIIEIKYVKPWRFYLKPFGKFDKLLEIPINDNNFYKFKLLISK
jgi:uncharacterized membrane protein (UPF0127 family)